MPAILVLIDNYASFRDKYMDIADSFTDIISSGKTFGVYFVITGNTRNSIYYKVTEHISSYFTLKMNDPSNYLDIHNVRPPVVPEDISGRGITVVKKDIVEFQTAIAIDGDTEADRITEITQKYCDIAEQWHGYTPITLDGTPEETSALYETPVSYYSVSPRSNPPESISDDSRNLVLGTSKSGALLYGIALSETNKVCVCANDISKMADFYNAMLQNMTQYSNRRFVFIDDDNGTFRDVLEAHPKCQYISGTTALDSFIEDLKPELNLRLEKSDEQHEQIFIIISEFNAFFDMITNEQAAFMRKVFQYIDSPQYNICFVCGFDVNGEKNNDRLFMSLVVNAENYVLCQNCYDNASAKIETLPLVSDVKSHSCYFCLGEKNVEIRW